MKPSRTRRTTDMTTYLAGLPDEARVALEHLRETIRAAAPGLEEGMSYGIPSFCFQGQALVCFAAFKTHCGFYPLSPDLITAFADELAAFDTSKGTIRFQPGRPLPDALVKRLVIARLAERSTSAQV